MRIYPVHKLPGHPMQVLDVLDIFVNYKAEVKARDRGKLEDQLKATQETQIAEQQYIACKVISSTFENDEI